MESKKFDLAVIGAGPGGYVAAIKAAQLGLSVCLIEKQHLGGTCLNVGCIPTKTLLAGAHVLHEVKRASQFGISTGPISFDYAKMKERKDSVIAQMRQGLQGLLQANQVTIVKGHAEFLSPKEIKVKGEGGSILIADQTIIASGSEPVDITAFPCDHKRIFNSTSILELDQLPKSIAIIGGGYIGCEFASLFAELGVKVTILEAFPAIVMAQGKAVSEALSAAFTKKGIELVTGVKVEGIDSLGSSVSVRIADRPALQVDIALVSVGRKVVSSELGLNKAGIATNDKGMISVNEKMQTSTPGIYAIGDVTGLSMLAHTASHQAIIAASNAAGKPARMHYNAIPAVIFTEPEIATVGLTLEQAIAAGYKATVGKFPFHVLGKSVASMSTEGFAQLVVDTTTGQILGAQVVGKEASTLIAEVALAMTNELTLDCIIDTVHAHPTVAESWLEAALVANDTPIHLPPKKRR
ncbi:MAG: dihydrolipoyl dehydrogenase [Chlamydiota bacterium]|jgi:dihydrolipoamide dehydrogenase